jgi:hypothetical protein
LSWAMRSIGQEQHLAQLYSWQDTMSTTLAAP